MPLYVTLARPAEVIQATWRDTMARGLAIGLPALLALLALGWAVWRKSRAAEAARLALLAEAELRIAAESAREAAEARRLAEAWFRGVFESRVVGMSVFDISTGQTLLANARLIEMTGMTLEDFEAGAWDWRRLTPPRTPAARRGRHQRSAGSRLVEPLREGLPAP